VAGPWALPDGWYWDHLENVAPVNPARDFGTLTDDDEIVFLPMAAVAERTGKIEPAERRRVGALRNGFTRFRSGDVIFAKITPCMENGKLAVIPELPHSRGAGSTEFHVIEPRQLMARYVFYWLSQQWFRDVAEHNMTGTAGQKRVPVDWLRLSVVPVPPRPVQKAVVARIDKLFAEIDDGERELAEARADLETYRRSLLKAAITGELTADWRRDNPPQETGADLLRRILAERRARWEANPRNGGKRYKEPVAPSAGLPDLPEGWTWATLQQLAFISGGVTVDAKRNPVDPVTVPYLRVANVQRGFLSLGAMKTITIDATNVEPLRLSPGDILLNEGGDRDKVGRGWVWEGQLETCVHQNHVFKARPAALAIEPKLVSLYLNEFGRNFFLSESKQTTNLASISLTKVSRVPVPVPPIAEARVMLAQFDECRPGFLADNIAATESEMSNLRQSILAAAFRGELAA
jgi:type I restriction enzyme S subunit